MKSDLSVRILAALALVLLVSRASEGRIVSKCELKAKLEEALARIPGGNGAGSVTAAPGTGNATVTENVTVSGNVTVPGNGNVPGNAAGNSTADLTLIARIVCSVEQVSRFNTNLVTPIRGDGLRGRPGRRGKRSPGGRSRPGSRRESSESSSELDSDENPITNDVITTLFGIFQLSDRLACDSGSGPTLNICKMKCSALIDDDITDDITCLKTLLDTPNSVIAPFLGTRPKQQQPFASVDQCRNVNPSSYFAGCP